MTKLCCVTYKDEVSAGKKARNDLEISYQRHIFAANMTRLGQFEQGDMVWICADENKKKFAFLAMIEEKVEHTFMDWQQAGGEIWKYNFRIRPLTDILDMTPHSPWRLRLREICHQCGKNENIMFNMRFCSEKLIDVVYQFLEQIIVN